MADQAAIDDNHIGRSSSHPLPRVALYVLMTVIGVLFSLFSVAYDYSVPGAEDDFIPQDVPNEKVKLAEGYSELGVEKT